MDGRTRKRSYNRVILHTKLKGDTEVKQSIKYFDKYKLERYTAQENYIGSHRMLKSHRKYEIAAEPAEN